MKTGVASSLAGLFSNLKHFTKMNIFKQLMTSLCDDCEELEKIKDGLTRKLSALLVLSKEFVVYDDQGNRMVFKAVEDDESVIRPAKFTQNEDGSTRKDLIVWLNDLIWLAGEITDNEPHDWTKL